MGFCCPLSCRYFTFLAVTTATTYSTDNLKICLYQCAQKKYKQLSSFLCRYFWECVCSVSYFVSMGQQHIPDFSVDFEVVISQLPSCILASVPLSELSRDKVSLHDLSLTPPNCPNIQNFLLQISFTIAQPSLAPLYLYSPIVRVRYLVLEAF